MGGTAHYGGAQHTRGLQGIAPVGVPAGQSCGALSWTLQCCAAPYHPKEELLGAIGCSTSGVTPGKQGDV